jgi:hypothetical protein
MPASKKPRKRFNAHRAFVSFDPLSKLMPAGPMKRQALLLRFGAALEQLARGQEPSMSEWRELADMVNTLETLADEMRVLDAAHTMPTVQRAIEAMVRAAQRNKTHGAPGLDGPGLQALQDCYAMICECVEVLTEATMEQARALTERRIHRARVAPDPGVVVVSA